MSVGLFQNPYGPMTLSQWSKARAHKDFEASLQTYQVGTHFEALNEPVLMAPSQIPGTLKLYSICSVFNCEAELSVTRI